ncbi:50S ribosomal protein L25 [Thermoclostridium stercorarium subsp. stercorarium DSM 8532]|jgi:large subunit ribosomal protein L25|uniref:Large ribosomal subunit protein bL25 n=3 Tax=Thermoclostridium stercorarium TaxID=1510 RepID=L7VQU2_THES1|nr:50S ribosomal protein L25 [Thermoclostridium stercorarium]AGC67943.1 50S ribosomal protein L25 [Thermoclostridium stercorarium subsp. stercorarium DSM 8532]AGI38979.1 ribosomal protein L25P [Thermoclostridium stercorarium subsp. stercorarium DSM 8532]ANW98347.1 50S ribosomal protein L25 [Thermoclostridium stercorarium subsp. thermolacticum DSM 2910]ANX00874.1 50S ribosomal protein L25 [Thermoclostridium stercorarium subsp. leptospartum DSM 9219]UZQ86488.1 50S ribosomal protein L25 [Thermocl
MNNINLNVQVRNTIGNGSANRLRNSGYIPGIVYGKDMEPTPIQIKNTDLFHTLKNYGQSTVYSITLNEQNIPAVIQDIQVDPIKREFLHVDLHRVSLDEEREAEVPVKIVGKSKHERNGAVFNQQLSHITVKGLPQDIPEYIQVNISDMEIGECLKIGDLVLPDNLEIINDSNEIIGSLTPSKPITEDLNLKDDTPANAVPIIGNDERETNAT